MRQGFGCLSIAAVATVLALICVVSGLTCMRSHGNFDCIGLVTVFPIAFLIVALISAAVGLTMIKSKRTATPTRPGISLGEMRDLRPLPRRDEPPQD